MTNVESVIRAYLASVSAITALVGTRIYASQNLPAGYKVSIGPAILLAPRGGGQDYSSKVLTPSVQFRCYAATETLARQVSSALYAALNDHAGGGFKYARLDEGTYPTLLSEPDTNWPYMLSFYQFSMANQ
jgi:hypothetical protein